jgi:hypothetical protein
LSWSTAMVVIFKNKFKVKEEYLKKKLFLFSNKSSMA